MSPLCSSYILSQPWWPGKLLMGIRKGHHTRHFHMSLPPLYPTSPAMLVFHSTDIRAQIKDILTFPSPWFIFSCISLPYQLVSIKGACCPTCWMQPSGCSQSIGSKHKFLVGRNGSIRWMRSGRLRIGLRLVKLPGIILPALGHDGWTTFVFQTRYPLV